MSNFVARVKTAAFFNTFGVSAGTLNWTHDINPTTSLSGSVSYSVSNNGAFLGNPGQSTNLATLQATLSTRGGRDVARQLAHVHEVRAGWAETATKANRKAIARSEVVAV